MYPTIRLIAWIRISALRVLAVVGLLCGLASCATNPVTGKRELVLVSEAQELQMGLNYSQQVDDSMGIYPDESLNRYVSTLGLSMAHASERPELPWKFQIVDSPVVNAFALPGGYIYFTRGILAHLNSEAALMGVMGHEIGHVTARHSVQQMSRAQLGQIGLGLGSVFLPEVRPYGDVLGQSLGLLFLRFGRDAERQSDELGVRYSLGQGYNAEKMASFFTVMRRLGEQSGRSIPSWASTHPDPVEREATIRRLVAEMSPNRQDLKIAEVDYKNRLDGLVYGDNPREGFVEGNRFVHPELKFDLSFPENWKIQNTRQAVYSAAPDGAAAMQLTASSPAPGGDPRDHALAFFQKNKMEYGTGEPLRLGAFPGYRAPFRVQTSSGAIGGEAAFIVDGEMAYEILGLTRTNTVQRYQTAFRQTIASFDRLRDAEALNRQPERLRIFRLPAAMNARQAFEDAGVEPDRLEEMALVNNLELDDPLQAGALIKVVGD